jgi:hypothetical protein
MKKSLNIPSNDQKNIDFKYKFIIMISLNIPSNDQKNIDFKYKFIIMI